MGRTFKAEITSVEKRVAVDVVTCDWCQAVAAVGPPQEAPKGTAYFVEAADGGGIYTDHLDTARMADLKDWVSVLPMEAMNDRRVQPKTMCPTCAETRLK